MKKLFALLAVVLGVVSCQTEPEGFGANTGDGNATISVVLPADTYTRAGGSDSAAGGLTNTTGEIVRVILQVYDANDKASKERLVDYLRDGELTANFNVRLVPNRKYTFVAWADQVDAEADVDKYYNTSDLKAVRMLSGSWNAMDERRDAYTDFEVIEKYNSSSEIVLNLTRPFAKLRIKTTDMVALNNLEIEPTTATISYSTPHYTTFNAFAGVAESKNNSGVAHSRYTIASYGEDWKNGADMTLYTDYFFAAAEQEVVNFTFEVFDQNGQPIKANSFVTPIPVKRNHLTTIAGDILTDGNNVSVKIEEGFAEKPIEVDVISGIINETITLSESGQYIFSNLTVNAESAVVVTAPAEVVIGIQGLVKLNGGIVVEDGAKLTINGVVETRSAERGGNLQVVATNGSAIGGNYITIENLASLTAKAADVNGAYGIGAIDAEVVIKNTKIDYVNGAFVQPLCINDPKYGKSEPEGASAIGGKKVTLDGVVLVKAEGGSKAAAIGNRYHQNTEVIVKNSQLGDVFGGNASAAIGGSRYSGDSKHNIKISIENSTIANAVGGQFGAGIGSGYDTHCNQQDYTATNEIVIKNSTINAKGGKYAAGIGTGFHSAYLTGSIDAESVIVSKAGDEVWYKNTYTTAQDLGYGVVDPAREFQGENANVTFTVAGDEIAEPSVICRVENKDEIKNALNNAVAAGNTEVIIDANGANIGNLNYGLTPAMVPAATTLTIRNAVVEGRSYGNGVNGTVIFDGCTFTNSGAYSIHFDNGSGEVIFKNCHLYGWNSFGSSLESVSFENCTLNGNGAYALIRSYVNLSLTDCTINISNANHTDEYSEGVEAVDGATLTENNVVYEVSNNDGLYYTLKAGVNNVNLLAGNYELSTLVFGNEACTLKGVDKENVVMNLSKSIYLQDKSVTLENLTFNTPVGLTYTESQYAFIHHATHFNLVNCNANTIRLNVSNANIEGCTFAPNTKSSFDGYGIFYYGNSGSKVVVNNSTFNTVSKGIVMYNEGAVVYDLEVNDCTFVASEKDDKAAIQMHSEWGISGKLVINRSTATGFADVNGGLWNEVNNNTKVETNKFNIFVDGVQVHFAYDGEVVAPGVVKKNNCYTIYTAEGLVNMSNITIKGYETVKLGTNIDLVGVEFNGLSAFNQEESNVFDGQNYTVSNWTNNGGASDMGFIKSWVGTIKNIKFENCHLKTSGRSAIVAANTYANIENVHVNNSSVEDAYWACGIIAGLYNSGSVSNCTVTNSSVKSNGGTAAIVGVFNESAGQRGLKDCSVSNTTIYNTGAYGEPYTGGALVGMFNSSATFTIENCIVSNNTLKGALVYDKYPADETVTIIEK